MAGVDHPTIANPKKEATSSIFFSPSVCIFLPFFRSQSWTWRSNENVLVFFGSLVRLSQPLRMCSSPTSACFSNQLQCNVTAHDFAISRVSTQRRQSLCRARSPPHATKACCNEFDRSSEPLSCRQTFLFRSCLQVFLFFLLSLWTRGIDSAGFFPCQIVS